MCIIIAKYLIGYGSMLESFLFASSSLICQIQKSSLLIRKIIFSVVGLKVQKMLCNEDFYVRYFGLSHVIFILALERKANRPAFSPEIISILNGLVIELYQMERKELFLLLLQMRL